MKKQNPRHGSMQFWPRKRAKKALARVRSWTTTKDAKPLGFVGYKVGMTHMMAKDTTAKNAPQAVPCTIIECPPIKILSVRFYRNNQLITEIFSPHIDNATKKALHIGKTAEKNLDDVKEYDDLRIHAFTQPGLTTTGKKTPDVFELGIGGTDKLAWVKEHLNKDINVQDVFEENAQVDAHIITRGKGYQGVIKRFGVNLRNHKAEKGPRRVGSRSGAWKAQAHMMYRVAQPGKMGYHLRTENNKRILKISNEPENPASGFKHYGIIKNNFIVVKGSIGGPTKRAVTLTTPKRPSKKVNKLTPGELVL